MLDPGSINLDEIASALAEQIDYDHRWLVDPKSGEVVLWTSDLGIDGENPVDLEELDLLPIDPLPSGVWHRDMVEFVAGLEAGEARERLEVALDGRGAFRRFKDELYRWRPELISSWHEFRDARGRRHALEWLVDEGLVSDEDATRFAEPDPN